MNDPLAVMREYRTLAPWSLRDLSAVAGAILAASGIRPINAAAAARPNERTIRFYVTRGLVAPPDGRGTSATYNYRHLLQVLFIKLRQMEGSNLGVITRDLTELSGDLLERRVAAALGAQLPAPGELPLAGEQAPPGGRSGRIYRRSLPEARSSQNNPSGRWLHVPVTAGVEIQISGEHALADLPPDQIAEVVRRALDRMLANGD